MELNLEYQPREVTGTVAVRKLRRAEDMVPAVIYGGDKKPQLIKIRQKHLAKISENESFFSQVVQLTAEKDKSKNEKTVLKSLQRHAYKRRFVHADFMRVKEDVKITMRVPIHFLNEDTCVGVKRQGGAVSHEMTELEVSCLPGDLPPFVEVDLEEVELHDILHIRDLKLPSGVEATALMQDKEGEHSHDLPVVRVTEQRVTVDEDEAEVVGEAEEPAEEGEADAETKEEDNK